MKTKHTKGEWIIEENVDHYPFILGDDNNVISKLIDNDGTLFYGRTLEETCANAKLIAAAPDLLEALTSLYTKFRGEGLGKDKWYGPIMENAKSAIKKATE